MPIALGLDDDLEHFDRDSRIGHHHNNYDDDDQHNYHYDNDNYNARIWWIESDDDNYSHTSNWLADNHNNARTRRHLSVGLLSERRRLHSRCHWFLQLQMSFFVHR